MVSDNPFRYDGRLSKWAYTHPPQKTDARYCNLCGRDFENGDEVVRAGGSWSHRCCDLHAQAAEAVGQSGYPGCKEHQ